ncbi:MAG TPA: thioesterase family protein [Ktedonobacterales bacterium]|jgi:acyl-CoA thioester hydrolase|nr:thioesterase family protein [Ktedonobacterales bacterium]
MPAASIRVRVPFVDVDSTQRIHYTAWLRFMEVAEHHLMREIGYSYATVLRDQAYPRVRLECDFRGAIQYDDELDVEARIERVGRSSWTVAFIGRHVGAPASEEPVATGKMTIVCMDPTTQRARPLPDDLRSALSSDLPS